MFARTDRIYIPPGFSAASPASFQGFGKRGLAANKPSFRSLLWVKFTFPLNSGRTMNYIDMPLIIPILAMAYVMTVYLLLSVAQKNSRLSQTQTQNLREVGTLR